MIFVVNDHIVRTVHNLAVHPDHKLFATGDFYSVGITVITGSPDIPFVTGDPVGIIIVDNDRPGTTGHKGTIEKFFGFGVDFNEH